jgi:hypothetical protein
MWAVPNDPNPADLFGDNFLAGRQTNAAEVIAHSNAFAMIHDDVAVFR